MSAFTTAFGSNVRGRLAVVLGAAALSIAIVTPATAGVTVIHGSVTIPFSDPGPIPDDCRPGITGSIVGTDVNTFHNVKGDNVWHVNLVIDETATLSWSDGSYTLDASTQHITWDRLTGWFPTRYRTPVARTPQTASTCSGRHSNWSSALFLALTVVAF